MPETATSGAVIPSEIWAIHNGVGLMIADSTRAFLALASREEAERGLRVHAADPDKCRVVRVK